jgi:hypothetical protein
VEVAGRSGRLAKSGVVPTLVSEGWGALPSGNWLSGTESPPSKPVGSRSDRVEQALAPSARLNTIVSRISEPVLIMRISLAPFL